MSASIAITAVRDDPRSRECSTLTHELAPKFGVLLERRTAMQPEIVVQYNELADRQWNLARPRRGFHRRREVVKIDCLLARARLDELVDERHRQSERTVDEERALDILIYILRPWRLVVDVQAAAAPPTPERPMASRRNGGSDPR